MSRANRVRTRRLQDLGQVQAESGQDGVGGYAVRLFQALDRPSVPLPLPFGERHTLHDVSLDGLGPMDHVVLECLAGRANEVVRIG